MGVYMHITVFSRLLAVGYFERNRKNFGSTKMLLSNNYILLECGGWY